MSVAFHHCEIKLAGTPFPNISYHNIYRECFHFYESTSQFNQIIEACEVHMKFLFLNLILNKTVIWVFVSISCI